MNVASYGYLTILPDRKFIEFMSHILSKMPLYGEKLGISDELILNIQKDLDLLLWSLDYHDWLKSQTHANNTLKKHVRRLPRSEEDVFLAPAEFTPPPALPSDHSHSPAGNLNRQSILLLRAITSSRGYNSKIAKDLDLEEISFM